MNRKARKDQIISKLQDLTQRFEDLEVNYRKETESIKNDIASLAEEVSKLDIEEEGYVTADEEEISEGYLIPVAKKVPSRNPDDLIDLFEIGKVVQINNTYKGQYGIVGVVYKISPKFVYFSDKDGDLYHRGPGNLLILGEDVNDYNEYRRGKGQRPVKFKPRKRQQGRKGKKFW